MGKLFGTDGVRGEANLGLTPETAFDLGRAGAHVLTEARLKTPKILIASDTRKSCFMLESAIAAGICSAGRNVVLAGVLPTPAVAYLTKNRGFDAGIVISASHNSFEDNGIKFFNSMGRKLPDEIENEIEDYIFNNKDKIPRPSGDGVGWGKRQDFADDYISFLKALMENHSVSDMKIALDCANGATYRVAPALFFELGAKVFVINNEPDGKNINLNCGSTHMGQITEYALNNKADIGVAFDGDGDRCHLVDENGQVVDGDQIMTICACHMKERGELKHDTIVATVMSNLGLFMMGRNEGINVEKTAVGDWYVLERMLEGGFNLGGEKSGHIIFSDYNTTGDGMLTALTVLKIMKETGLKLSELNRRMRIMPQVLLNADVPSGKKYAYMENEAIKKAVSEAERKYENSGRIVIRPSGTESYIRVMIEGDDEHEIKSDAEKLAAIIEREMR